MIKKLLAFFALAGFGTIFYNLFDMFVQKGGNSSLGIIAKNFAANGAKETGAANLVTSVVVTYRGLDTLGEVTILFLTAAIVAFFLHGDKNEGDRKVRPASEILEVAATLITPIMLLLGAYVFINGHLTPGGGFQGGAIMASAMVLLLVADPNRKIRKIALTVVESISGVAYVGIGIAGVFLIEPTLFNGFLSNKILPLGEFGTICSAGAIPVIYTLVGLKVGAELSNILVKFNGSQEDA